MLVPLVLCTDIDIVKTAAGFDVGVEMESKIFYIL